MTTGSRADAGAGSNYTFLTLKERDNETGLDFFEARYYASTQGRFTAPDPLLSSGLPAEPASWNRYVYCLNAPLKYVDPNGLIWQTRTTVKDNVSTTEYQWVWQDDPEEGWDRVTNFHPDVMGPDGKMIGLRLNPDGPLSKTQKFLEDMFVAPFSNDSDYHVKGYEFTANSADRKFLSDSGGVDMLQGQAFDIGLTFAGLRGAGSIESAVARSGLSMEGKAYELGFLSKHLPGTEAAAAQVAKDGKAFLFNDLSTVSRVESEIFARGTYTGSRAGFARFGFRFGEPIGSRVTEGGARSALDYGELKLRENGLYHVVPRTGPSKTP